MHIKLQSPKAKRIKKLRSSTVEPVLGTLVNYLGMWRVNTRGLEQANKCMLMAAIACNLKKLLKFTVRKVQTNVQVMQVNPQALFLGYNRPYLSNILFISATLFKTKLLQ